MISAATLSGFSISRGSKDLTPASDLAEGLLNNVDRPPVRDREGGTHAL